MRDEESTWWEDIHIQDAEILCMSVSQSVRSPSHYPCHKEEANDFDMQGAECCRGPIQLKTFWLEFGLKSPLEIPF